MSSRSKVPLIRSLRRRVAGSVRRDCEAKRLAVSSVDEEFNFVDCITGKSAGLAPLRMRPT